MSYTGNYVVSRSRSQTPMHAPRPRCVNYVGCGTCRQATVRPGNDNLYSRSIAHVAVAGRDCTVTDHEEII